MNSLTQRQQLISNLQFLNNFFESNHLKKSQTLTVSLGIKDDEDQDSFDYTINLTFPKFVDYGTDKMRELTIKFDLLKNTGFTFDNAEVAKDLFITNYFIIKEYVEDVWQDYAIGLRLDTNFPEKLKNYLDHDQYQALLEAENQNI